MKRRSSIELLKIFTIMLIVLSHCVQSFNLPVGVASKDTIELSFNFIRCFGQFGNIVFIVCSFWFLLEKETSNVKKIFILVVDVFWVSIVCLSICAIFHVDFSNIELIKQFAPVLFENNWFINCYILLYLLYPVLNKIIYSMSKIQLFRTNLLMFYLFSILQFVLKGNYFFNELIGFVYIYFIVAFVKLHVKKIHSNYKFNLVMFIAGFLGNTMLILITNFLGLRIVFMKTLVLYWNFNIANPFYIAMALSLFLLISNINIQNSAINYVSSLTLFIYLFHENYLFRTYVRPWLCEHFLKYNSNYISSLFMVFVIVFVLSVLISIIYFETVHKIVSEFIGKTYDKLVRKYKMIENLIVNRIE